MASKSYRAAEMAKVVVAKRGIELKSHRDLWGFVDKLAEELKDQILLGPSP